MDGEIIGRLDFCVDAWLFGWLVGWLVDWMVACVKIVWSNVKHLEEQS